MGVKVAMASPVPFFEKVTPEIVPKVMTLIEEGVDITIGFFTVTFQTGGKQLAGCSMPVSTTTLMKNAANHSAKQMCVQGLTLAVDEAYGKLHPDAVDTVAYLVAGLPYTYKGKKYLKGEIIQLPKDKNTEGSGLTLLKSDTSPLELPDVPQHVVQKKSMGSLKAGKIALAQADHLLQKVKGTDASSTYHTVALGDRVKVAARVKKQALSLRIEGKLNQQEKQQAESAGFVQSSQGHLSLHINCANVPPVAVIGGMLFRLGVSFREIITNEKEIPVES